MARGEHDSIAAVLFVLLEDEVVGHAGDVVADDARERIFLGFFLVIAGKSCGMIHPEGEEFADDALRVIFFSRQG